VIPRLTRSGPVMPRSPEWPTEPRLQSGHTGALFETRPPLRKLVVLADADLLAAPSDMTLSERAILTGMLKHPYVKLLKYRDAGPASDSPPSGGIAEGWAELQAADKHGVRSLVYKHVSEASVCTSVFGERAEYARGDTMPTADREYQTPEAADQRERDAMAAQAAMAVNADLFITERPYLFETRMPVVQGVTLSPITNALAVVGLYLRSQREFLLPRVADGSGTRMNEWLYYQVGAVGLLPELWRWSAAREQVGAEDDKQALSGLHDALVQRVQRALRTRDSFCCAYNLPQHRDAVRTMLVELDTLLVLLMGVVDATARFVHLLLNVDGKPREAGWQKPEWRSKLAEHDRALGELFEVNQSLADTVTVLTQLRNTVHGQVIGVTLRQDGRLRDAVIRLPGESEHRILASMDRLDGRAAWGVQAGSNGSAVVDPGQLVAELFPRVMALLNAVIERTPLGSAAGQRPSGDGHPWFNQRNQRTIRWQLGL